MKCIVAVWTFLNDNGKGSSSDAANPDSPIYGSADNGKTFSKLNVKTFIKSDQRSINET